MAAEEALEEAKRVMVERDMIHEEVDQLYMALRADFRATELLNINQ